MATNSKTAAKPTSKANLNSSAKKAAPAKSATAGKEIINIKKNAASKPDSDAGKKAPAKKDTPVKKAAKTDDKTVVKKNNIPVAPAKKAAAPKKVEEPKKAVTQKKAAPAKEQEPVKPAAKPVAAKPPVKAAPAKAPVKKVVIPIKQMPVKAIPSSPRPMATPAARSVDKKPGVVIAHRRMENKAKVVNEPANTMIQYLPETYRSILDEPQLQQGPAYRYSDDDLQEFKEIITSRIEAARKELNYLQGLITRKDEAGTEDTENRYMNMEDGSGAMEREQMAQLASRQIQFMGNLEKALVRIENKTYGICRVTGKLIDKARLRAVPHATLSIDAKKMMSSK
jgi:RNA polymerase-binding transcription factor DksA